MFCVMVLESRMEMGLIALAGERCVEVAELGGGCSNVVEKSCSVH